MKQAYNYTNAVPAEHRQTGVRRPARHREANPGSTPVSHFELCNCGGMQWSILDGLCVLRLLIQLEMKYVLSQ
jgi:hypothetical protein